MGAPAAIVADLQLQGDLEAKKVVQWTKAFDSAVTLLSSPALLSTLNTSADEEKHASSEVVVPVLGVSPLMQALTLARDWLCDKLDGGMIH